MKRFCITLLALLFIILIGLSFVGCGNPTVPPEELSDTNVLTELLEYDFTYTFSNKSSHPYRYLWDHEAATAADPTNCTYLTEYGAMEQGYYLVYMKRNLIPECKTFLNSAYADFRDDGWYSLDWNFTDSAEERIIDGKYFYAFQNIGENVDENLILCYTLDVKTAPLYYKDDYQLVFCAQRRIATILENVTTGVKLNKEITIYSRKAIQYSNQNQVSGDTPALAGQERANAYSKFKGRMLECFPSAYEEMTFANYPQRGYCGYSEDVIPAGVEVVKRGYYDYYVALPRYTEEYGLWLVEDFLVEGLVEERDDVFKDYWEYFVEAHILAERVILGKMEDPMYTQRVFGSYAEETIYGLYDYEAIRSLIWKEANKIYNYPN